MEKEAKNIRNFSIIAHIDHGKSTLADRLLEITGTLPKHMIKEQTLDTMDLERERGITIKAHPVRMEYEFENKKYVLNLIDTPGHVDFTYEVSRSLAACEGAVLLVDASQGVEAQTVSNYYLAKDLGLTIIPVINKIDLPNADIEGTKEQIFELTEIDPDEILLCSAKTGEGVEEILKAIIKKIPPPKGNKDLPLRALIFDSIYTSYYGVIPYVRIFEGEIKPGDKIYLYSLKKEFIVEEVGHLILERKKTHKLSAGETGYIIAGIKDPNLVRVGDTIVNDLSTSPLPGYREIKPYVFCGFYPTTEEGYEKLKDALTKLHLNDPAFTFEKETSEALGFGFRCGFLGLLHMEIIQERLEREFGQGLIATLPSVKYKVILQTGEEIWVENPSKFPEEVKIKKIEEPYVKVEIITPPAYIGGIMDLCLPRRAEQKKFLYLDPKRVLLEFEMPLSEMIYDFYDKLKSVSSGMASMDYEIIGYKESKIVKVNILINRKPVDALSFLVHKENAYRFSRKIVDKLRELIPRQLFEVNVQAGIGKRIIASARIPPMRKDVTAKCYGGDITRKMKLLEKQKEGKKRLKKIGRVEVPQEAFFSLLKVEK